MKVSNFSSVYFTVRIWRYIKSVTEKWAGEMSIPEPRIVEFR